ncbi:hypothetical protein [Sphingomonas alba]|uniref:Uncharacterized protein n=1 Tax=Sphingomonas alba TaxID=2908208 RepID=A0ABT0RJA6_9SPHN|nr:hypothetical protein [Sphingomonas alba]MCL6682663.1 hypothetical protein [Sphingomonas alba]
MDRSLYLDMPEGEVVTKCLSAKVGISVIERLPEGGVRLVCASMAGADIMRRKLRSRLLKGDVTRTALRPAGPIW